MVEKYLPVGTIVHLFNGKKNVMVCGFCIISKEDGKMYDYVGCLYPEGMVSSEFNLLFNHEQVQDVLHMGLVNAEEQAFKVQLNSIIAQKQAAGELPAKGVVQPVASDTETSQNTNNVASQPQMFGGNQN